ncbi:hypothetical protein B0H66DRAFT_535626 [Apodospora peruviana]|uniref:Uncharacterized protein n=1 Tax=Apodospora peruviana TaxID=516989 RepID=A0AAE0HXL5_9PEZI|nr:hypothetical protein B0H66DRAFT_535626 [Apodospora peruviana]
MIHGCTTLHATTTPLGQVVVAHAGSLIRLIAVLEGCVRSFSLVTHHPDSDSSDLSLRPASAGPASCKCPGDKACIQTVPSDELVECTNACRQGSSWQVQLAARHRASISLQPGKPAPEKANLIFLDVTPYLPLRMPWMRIRTAVTGTILPVTDTHTGRAHHHTTIDFHFRPPTDTQLSFLLLASACCIAVHTEAATTRQGVSLGRMSSDVVDYQRVSHYHSYRKPQALEAQRATQKEAEPRSFV